MGSNVNTFIRQRVAADKYNIQLIIHTRQDNTTQHKTTRGEFKVNALSVS